MNILIKVSYSMWGTTNNEDTSITTTGLLAWWKLTRVGLAKVAEWMNLRKLPRLETIHSHLSLHNMVLTTNCFFKLYFYVINVMYMNIYLHKNMWDYILFFQFLISKRLDDFGKVKQNINFYTYLLSCYKLWKPFSFVTSKLIFLLHKYFILM